jgi:hypothetical protein
MPLMTGYRRKPSLYTATQRPIPTRNRRVMDKSRAEISIELSRQIERQTKFFDPTPSEIQEFEWAGERIRKLFAELAQLNKAA